MAKLRTAARCIRVSNDERVSAPWHHQLAMNRLEVYNRVPCDVIHATEPSPDPGCLIPDEPTWSPGWQQLRPQRW